MASHEHDHDEKGASRAGDQGTEGPVEPGEPGFDVAGSGEFGGQATDGADQAVDGEALEEAAPAEVRPDPVVAEPADPVTNGVVDPFTHDASGPAVAGATDPVEAEPVDPPANGDADSVTSYPASIDPGNPPVGWPVDPAELATNRPAGPATDGAGEAGRRTPEVEESRAPSGAPAPRGRAAGGGGPPARGRAAGPTARRPSGPPRNRRRPPAAGRTTTSRPTTTPDGPEEPPAGRPTGLRGMVILLSVLSVLVVILTLVAVSLSRSADRNAAAPTTTTSTTRPVATLPDAAFTTFRDDETGFTIRHPSTWERLTVPLREIRLFVSNGGAFSAQVRVQRTDQATTAENLGNLRSFTDGSVAGEGVQVLKVDPVTINGLIGYRYLYTFVDSSSGIQGAHLHYFLFQGHKMNSIVFQALPTEEFTKAEGVFNQMLDSFRSDPEPAAAPAPGAPSSPRG